MSYGFFQRLQFLRHALDGRGFHLLLQRLQLLQRVLLREQLTQLQRKPLRSTALQQTTSPRDAMKPFMIRFFSRRSRARSSASSFRFRSSSGVITLSHSYLRASRVPLARARVAPPPSSPPPPSASPRRLARNRYKKRESPPSPLADAPARVSTRSREDRTCTRGRSAFAVSSFSSSRERNHLLLRSQLPAMRLVHLVHPALLPSRRSFLGVRGRRGAN